MDELPPKPPRFPPGLISWNTAFVLLMNLLAIGLNLYLSHWNASAGNSWILLFNCSGAALGFWSLWIFAQRIRRALFEWNGLLNAWEQLDALMKERKQRK